MAGKLFVGAQLRRLREKYKLHQSAMAERLGLSFSYVCQLENNQRPVTAAVLLKLTEVFDFDLADFSEEQNKRLLPALRTLFRDRTVSEADVSPADIERLVQQVPTVAGVVVALYQKHLRLHEEYRQLIARFYGDQHHPHLAPLPHEAVRDFFNLRNNHFELLDNAAEALAQEWQLQPGQRMAALRELMKRVHGVEVVSDSFSPQGPDATELRHYDARRRQLRVSPYLSDAQQAFQIATQLALLAYGELVDQEIEGGTLADEQSRALARQGLAHYFAGALLMPYGQFLGHARQCRYDVEALQQRFQVGFESVCHRLSTLQRSGARGVPFYLVRVDQAGNISKHQSATAFHFASQGGGCPLWHVHDAFSSPGRIITQVAELPDGTRFFGMARTIERGGGAFFAQRKLFAIGLGCELRHARELVYADGVDLSAERRAVPIGPGCRVCPRAGCAQRAFPPAGKALFVDLHRETLASYRFVDTEPS